MQGNIDIVTLLSLVVAIIVILKLRSVLGRRTNEDEARIDRQMRGACNCGSVAFEIDAELLVRGVREEHEPSPRDAARR